MINEYRSETLIDQWIRNNIFPNEEYKGVMVEVGAATPEYISNSYHWRVNEWRTISIEPNPIFAEEHRKVGSEVVQCGVSDYNGVGEFIMVGEERGEGITSWHSFSHLSEGKLENIANDWKEVYNREEKKVIEVSVRTLNSILEEKGIDKIDILTIDVEGLEEKVLGGFDLEKYKPKVVVIENVERKDFHSIMKGYHLDHKTIYDDLWLRKED
jgi:FkbM family methyltransferase